jgi:enoyl-CoA hydratase
MLEAMAEKLDQANADTSTRVLIMRSSGKHASFGADLNELVVETETGYGTMPKDEAEKHVEDGRVVARKLFALRVPTIGIAQGFCLGGGAEFYTLCDVLYGAAGGKEEGGLVYGFPEPTIGVMAGWMGPETLIRRIGAGHALDILCSGRLINADEALTMGVVQALHPKEELLTRALKWASTVAANAPYGVESTRRTLMKVLFPEFMSIAETTGSETVNNLMTDDFVKGATKILRRSKEQPTYKRK